MTTMFKDEGIIHNSQILQLPYLISHRTLLILFSVDKASKPSKELLQKAEAAYALFAESGERFYEGITSRDIEKPVLMFILNTDPWFRPRASAPPASLFYDEVGKGVWVINGSDEVQSRMFNNRAQGMDDVDLIKMNGGVYYESSACAYYSIKSRNG